MKKLLLLSALSLILISVSAQTSTSSSGKSIVNPNMIAFYNAKNSKPINKIDTTRVIEKFAIATFKKDTLFILKSEIGDMTYNIWKEDPKYKGTNPVIIRIDNISYYEKKYSYVANDKKLRN